MGEGGGVRLVTAGGSPITAYPDPSETDPEPEDTLL